MHKDKYSNSKSNNKYKQASFNYITTHH